MQGGLRMKLTNNPELSKSVNKCISMYTRTYVTCQRETILILTGIKALNVLRLVGSDFNKDRVAVITFFLFVFLNLIFTQEMLCNEFYFILINIIFLSMLLWLKNFILIKTNESLIDYVKGAGGGKSCVGNGGKPFNYFTFHLTNE